MRRVQDSRSVQPVAVFRLGELIVRAACSARQRSRGKSGAAPSDGARRVQVALGADHLVGRDDGCAGRRRTRLVDVGDEHLRTAACSRRTRSAPTEPTACTGTRKPASSGEPKRCSTVARIAYSVPTAVPRALFHPAGGPVAIGSTHDDVEVGGSDVHVPGCAIRPRRASDDRGRRSEEQPRERVADRSSGTANTPSRRPRGMSAAAKASASSRRTAHARPLDRRLPWGPRARPCAAAAGAKRSRFDADEHPRAAVGVEPDDRLFAVPGVRQPLEQVDLPAFGCTPGADMAGRAPPLLLVVARDQVGLAREPRRLRRQGLRTRRPVRRRLTSRHLRRRAGRRRRLTGAADLHLDSRRRDRRRRRAPLEFVSGGL